MRRMLLPALLVAVVACWQVREAAQFDFVEHDDGINIVFNPHLGPWSRDTLGWAFSDSEYVRRYVPLGWLGLAGVYGVSGLSPVGYHLANVGLHGVNSLLVFVLVLVLVRRFAPGVEERWRRVAALVGAFGWALHPFRAETVGWASGLWYGLAACFALLSVLAYLRAWSGGARRPPWFAAAVLFYTAAVLTYPMSLGTVGVFVVLDWAHRPGCPEISWQRLAAEKIVLALPFLAMVGITIYAGRSAPEYWPRLPGIAEFSVASRLLQAGSAWAYFLWKPWWPADLTPVPTGWLVPETIRLQAVASLAGVTTVSVFFVLMWRRCRGAALLWWAHLLLLAPMLGLTERPYFPNDRYHYLAGVVLAVAMSLAIARTPKRGRVMVVLAVGAIVAGWGFAQRSQLRIWSSTDTLMERIVEKAGVASVKREYSARWAGFHEHRGRRERAEEVARKEGLPPASAAAPAGRDIPPAAALHLRLAMDFLRDDRRCEAHQHFQAALTVAPDWAEAAHNWAILRVKDGAAAEALHLCQKAVRGRGPPVPLAARQRLLLLIAEAFHGSARPVLAVRAVELAMREGGTATEPGLAALMRARIVRYRGEAGR